MLRRTEFQVLAVLGAMVLIWSLTSSQDSQEDFVATTPISEARLAVTPPSLPASSPSPSPSPSPIRVEESMEQTQRRQELLRLQEQLRSERERREDQARLLEDLKRRQQNLPAPGVYTFQIQRYDTEIQNLLDLVNRYQEQSQEVERATEARRQTQQSHARWARDQVDVQIQRLEEELRRTQEELREWQNTYGLDVNQQRLRIEQLQSQMTEQQNQLNALRDQRVELSATIFNDVGTLFSLEEQARSELQEVSGVVQEQIFTLRTEIDRLQGSRFQSQNEATMLKTQISQTEQILRNHDQAIKNLQQQILNKQSELGL